MSPPPDVLTKSTDELLYELLKLTRREQWEAEPLRFGHEVFGHHFSKPPARMHQQIMAQVTGTRVGESLPPMNTPLPFSPSVSVAKSVSA